MPIGKVWYRYTVYCLFVILSVCVCTVTDFSAEDKASGIRFCTVVYRHPRRGITIFANFASPEVQNRTNRPARGPQPPACKHDCRDVPT